MRKMKVAYKDGMLPIELEQIQKILTKYQIKEVLEVGLANATSAIAILEVISKSTGSKLTSIDPYQRYPLKPSNNLIAGYDSKGLENILAAGYSSFHEYIEQPSYLALPELVKQNKKYDLILIDGYHSFDYTFVDFFYSDLLLKDGGIILLHDTNLPTVYPVCSFILQDKKYQQIGPAVQQNLNCLLEKLKRRFKILITGKYSEFLQRKNKWGSLGAFQKTSNQMLTENELISIRSC